MSASVSPLMMDASGVSVGIGDNSSTSHRKKVREGERAGEHGVTRYCFASDSPSPCI